ncbi:MAG TPA: protein kinase [Polyangiaceae bacterium]|nr:protein kinase [Polyangiaceae bacterium]
MRKPPDVHQGPTWGAGSVIIDTPYVVLRELGRGGMGTVYEVRHLDLRQIYALKVLSTRVAEHPELAERVVREAEFLGLVKGAPYVVTVVAWGRLNDAYRRPYFVMERLYGETLHALLARRSLPLAEALSYVRHALWGLVAVHAEGVVHRDIKPSNLFVRRDGTCTLLDFGVMKALYDIGLSPSQFSTGPHALIGTPLYMAPEMASRGPVDHRADLFSVGLVLAECLLGVRLLSHLSEREYLERLINEGVPSLELAGGEHLPGEVRGLVRRATMHDPVRRFHSALAFLREIDRVAEALGLRLWPLSPSVPPVLGAPPPRALAHHAATTPSAYDSNAPTPRVYRAPSLLTPSEHATPIRGVAAGPAVPPTSSARPTSVDSVSPTRPTPVDSVLSTRPTPVDSVSPTRVKTPSPRSGPEPTPPLRSHARTRFRFLTLGWGGRAPKTPSPRPGAKAEPPATTLPLPPTSAVALLVLRLRDRLAPLPELETPPVNDVLEGPAPVGAPAAPALEPSAGASAAPALSAPAAPALEPSAGAPAASALESSAGAQAPEGALPAATARPRRGRRVPLVSAVAFGVAGVAVGVAMTVAVFWWAGPPAVVRVSPEPPRAAPAGVVAPAVTPALEPPAEPQPPQAPSKEPAPPSVSATGPSGVARKRAALEAKLRSGRGTLDDVHALRTLCHVLSDEICLEHADAYLDRLTGAR